jgi:calpain-7
LKRAKLPQAYVTLTATALDLDSLRRPTPKCLHLSLQSCESQLQTAATKDEALRLAISVAENLVKAIKLSSSVQEKKELKAKCGAIMDTADRIKKSENWTPLAPPVRQSVEQWAADVLPGSPPHEASSAQSMSSVLADLSLNSTGNTRATSGKSHTLSSTTLQASQNMHDPADLRISKSGIFDSHVGLSKRRLDLLNMNPASPLVNNQPKANPQGDGYVNDGLSIAQSLVVTPKLDQPSASPPMHIQCDEQHQGPPIASQPRVRKLAPPVSTRKLTKKEQILLLKASVVNGFKCPPWDANPASSEFALGEEAEMFTYVRTINPHIKRLMIAAMNAS